jgi:hypothetical protein
MEGDNLLCSLEGNLSRQNRRAGTPCTINTDSYTRLPSCTCTDQTTVAALRCTPGGGGPWTTLVIAGYTNLDIISCREWMN